MKIPGPDDAAPANTPVKVSARWILRAPPAKAPAHGVVSLDEPALKVDGGGPGIAPEDAILVFRRNVAHLNHCYDELLRRSPGAGGSVAVSLLVSLKGKVQRVGYRDLSLGDEPFAQCLTKELRAWRFPRPDAPGPVKVDYPAYEFRPP